MLIDDDDNPAHETDDKSLFEPVDNVFIAQINFLQQNTAMTSSMLMSSMPLARTDGILSYMSDQNRNNYLPTNSNSELRKSSINKNNSTEIYFCDRNNWLYQWK